jgi:hypothetical protein
LKISSKAEEHSNILKNKHKIIQIKGEKNESTFQATLLTF